MWLLCYNARACLAKYYRRAMRASLITSFPAQCHNVVICDTIFKFFVQIALLDFVTDSNQKKIVSFNFV